MVQGSLQNQVLDQEPRSEELVTYELEGHGQFDPYHNP